MTATDPDLDKDWPAHDETVLRARVDDLLASNNRFQQEARDARAEAKAARETLRIVEDARDRSVGDLRALEATVSEAHVLRLADQEQVRCLLHACEEYRDGRRASGKAASIIEGVTLKVGRLLTPVSAKLEVERAARKADSRPAATEPQAKPDHEKE